MQILPQNQPFHINEIITTFSGLSKTEIYYKYELLTQEYDFDNSNLVIIFEKWQKSVEVLEMAGQTSSLKKEFQELFEKQEKAKNEYFEKSENLKNLLNKIIFCTGYISGLEAENNLKSGTNQTELEPDVIFSDEKLLPEKLKKYPESIAKKLYDELFSPEELKRYGKK